MKFSNSYSLLTALSFLMLLVSGCRKTEPAFIVKVDTAIAKDVKVNVELIKPSGASISTAYQNGKSYEIDNEGAIRYTIYIAYQNRYFQVISMDNLHGKLKGEPINELAVAQDKDVITALYRPFKESSTVGGAALQPSKIFFSQAAHKVIASKNFTGLYTTNQH